MGSWSACCVVGGPSTVAVEVDSMGKVRRVAGHFYKTIANRQPKTEWICFDEKWPQLGSAIERQAATATSFEFLDPTGGLKAEATATLFRLS